VLSLAKSKRSGKPIADFPNRLHAAEQRAKPQGPAKIRPADPLSRVPPASMCNRAAEKTKAKLESAPQEAKVKCNPLPLLPRFFLLVSYPFLPSLFRNKLRKPWLEWVPARADFFLRAPIT
jgi:hypothetical protein